MLRMRCHRSATWRTAGAPSAASGVLGRAVAGDDLDIGMAPQPVGEGRPGSVGLQVDRASTVAIDEQHAVAPPFADGPIVDAHGPRPIRARQRQAAHETQDRIGAGLHPQMVGQARTGLATRRKPDAGLGLCAAARPACSRRHQLREWFGEGATATGATRAVKASDAQTQRHGLTDARQIGRAAFIAAVNGRADRATGWATPMHTLRMGEDDRTTVPPDDALDGAARQGRGQDHPPGESARAIPRHRDRSTQNAGEPQKRDSPNI